MRARLALRFAGIEVSVQEIELRNRPPELYAVSPKATVPVLVLDDGTVIDESFDIVKWCLPISDEEQSLIAACDGDFKHHLDRYKYATRYPGADELEHRSQGSVFLLRLNTLLENKAYLFDGKSGVAELCLAPFIRQFRIADIDWFDQQPWPELHDWLQRFLASEDFVAIMVKVKS